MITTVTNNQAYFSMESNLPADVAARDKYMLKENR